MQSVDEKGSTGFSRSIKKGIQLGRDQQTLDAFVRQLRKVTRNFLHVCPSVCPCTQKRGILNFVETFGFCLKSNKMVVT